MCLRRSVVYRVVAFLGEGVPQLQVEVIRLYERTFFLLTFLFVFVACACLYARGVCVL